ncbi:MAG: hypothetical protein WC732_09020 [Candidatus Omnitrophota bacterium]
MCNRGLAAAIPALGTADRHVIDAVNARVVAGNLSNPIIPRIPRAYFESCLYPPDPALGERQCLADRSCIACLDIPGWHNVEGVGPLKEFKFPSGGPNIWADIGAPHLTPLLPTDRMPCILCLIASAEIHHQACMRQKQAPGELLQAFQVSIGPGEFANEECIQPWVNNIMTGVPYPFPRFEVSKFGWMPSPPDPARPTAPRAYVRYFFARSPSPARGLPPTHQPCAYGQDSRDSVRPALPQSSPSRPSSPPRRPPPPPDAEPPDALMAAVTAFVGPQTPPPTPPLQPPPPSPTDPWAATEDDASWLAEALPPPLSAPAAAASLPAAGPARPQGSAGLIAALLRPARR